MRYLVGIQRVELTSDECFFQVDGFRFNVFPDAQSVEDSCHIGCELDSGSDEA
jgi:hypothetical protein